MKKILVVSLLVISSISYGKDCISDNPFIEPTWVWTGMGSGCLETYIEPFEFNEMETCFVLYYCCCQTYINIFPGDCNTVAIDEDEEDVVIEDFFNNKKLMKTIDALGRETTNKGFQLHIYDDGFVEKKYVIK